MKKTIDVSASADIQQKAIKVQWFADSAELSVSGPSVFTEKMKEEGEEPSFRFSFGGPHQPFDSEEDDDIWAHCGFHLGRTEVEELIEFLTEAIDEETEVLMTKADS